MLGCALSVLMLVTAATSAFGQNQPLTPPAALVDQGTSSTESTSRPNESFHEFVSDTIVSPYPYVYAAAGGTLDQLTKFPDEWKGPTAFAKRISARVAEGFVADSVAHATAALARQRIDYDPCTCAGTAARTKHALSRAFVAIRNDGRPVPNWPLWASKYSSAGVANAWYPESYTRRDAIIQASSAVAISAGLNVLREFAHFK